MNENQTCINCSYLDDRIYKLCEACFEAKYIIIAFCKDVDELAQKKMLLDGKVEGKHYTSICELLQDKFGYDFEAEKRKENQGKIIV